MSATFVPSSPHPEPVAADNARAELARLVHGPCPSSFLDVLEAALSADPMPVVPDPLGREKHIARRLRRLGKVLPTAREMFEQPELPAALLAWAAVAEPALCMTLVGHQLLGLGSMVHLQPEPDALKDQIEAVQTGRSRCAYLITEVGRSNSHLATRTRAEFDPATREFVLVTPDTGAAKFSNVAADGVPLTVVPLARVIVNGADCGVFSFVVDLTDGTGPLPGVEMSTPIELGALPLDYAQVRFHGLRLPFERWLRDNATIDEQGRFHDPLGSTDARLQRTLCVGMGLWGTLPSAAAAVSRQSAVLAVRYARRRSTEGRLAQGTPLIRYRTQQHGVLGAMADAFALTCAAQQARTIWATSLAQHPGGGPSDEDGTMTFAPWSAVSRPLSAYKAHTVREAARITAVCQRHCGFAGHLDINKIAAYHSFHYAFDAAGGDIQLIYYDLGRALAGEADSSVPPATPPAVPSPTDAAWWPTVIRAHEQRLAHRLHRRRAERVRRDPDDFDVWNPLLADAGELGEVYAARLAAEDVHRVLASVHAPFLKTVLEPLAALHGVLSARRRAGSLLGAESLRPRDLEQLSEHADRLCDQLMPHLPFLEEAFAYPHSVVAAPLGAPDYDDSLAGALSWLCGGAS